MKLAELIQKSHAFEERIVKILNEDETTEVDMVTSRRSDS